MVDVDDKVAAASTLTGPDYQSAFAIDLRTEPGSPEQWARNIFEGAPYGLRQSLLLGWKGVLALRLGPLGSAEHVLGWTIEATSPVSITLASHSAIMTAQKVVRVEGSHLVVATFVRFDRRWARLVWWVVLPVHRRLEPALLTDAASRAPR